MAWNNLPGYNDKATWDADEMTSLKYCCTCLPLQTEQIILILKFHLNIRFHF